MEMEQAYLETLEALMSEKGEAYALRTAAITISALLSMVSRAACHLPDMPLFLPQEDGGEEK